MVVVVALMSGTLGVPNRALIGMGFTSMDVPLTRLLFSTLALAVLVIVVDKGRLNLRRRDIPLLILFGVFKFLSDLANFNAQLSVSLSLAALLQMMCPVYVMILSLFIFKERITLQKLSAMFMAFVGCILVTGVLFENEGAAFEGMLCAMLSGLFLGLYSIGSKMTLDRGYSAIGAMFLLFLTATVVSIPFADAPKVICAVGNVDALTQMILLSIVLTFIPYLADIVAMKHISATAVTMITCLKIVSAAVVGYILYNEHISHLNLIGMALVIGSVIVMNVKLHEMAVRYRTKRPVKTDVETCCDESNT